ncbi:amino acid ABC transporter substrate-binding protein [Coriobacteriaceae bacterium]|uniref:Amino acid ABC transporter substrate-binding protein n=1 Tax=Granulimonas faecalis TaxID=2894155 RepID=A0AAV5B0F1_9ACTN|nr:ABC transporter substrate-binding protein [Granulimonas faecalis]MBF0599007.1 ABC transporter substrate-binding protein [Atopobiaceae bacterium FL090493]TGY60222.1 amino acid ABC transporter substrate-binding protein [Coriobacteriaceae bacterium]GJM55131.1 amino acid ABC transporter substrate-binding protein [Granulimonas faecalis]
MKFSNVSRRGFVQAMGVAGAAGAVALTGCGNSASGGGAGAGSDGGKFKLGGIGPVTGPTAIYGNACKNAAQIAVDEIDASDSTFKFDYRFEDDENNAEKSVNAFNTLKDWGMQMLMGTTTTAPCIAVSKEANADNIFELTPSASSTDVIGGQEDASGNISETRKPNVFQMCFTDPNQGVASAKYISEQKLGTKVGIIYDSSDAYSTGIDQKFLAEAKQVSLEVVANEAFTADSATDFSTQLNNCKNAGADILFLPIYYTPASIILKQANDMGYKPKFFGVDGMDGILTLAGFDESLAEGVMLLTPFNADATDEKTQAFVKSYKDKFGEIPNQFAADAYDCVYALQAALEKGGCTPDMSASDVCDKLVEVFTSGDFTFDGLTGETMAWSDTGEVSKEPKGMVIQGGQYVGME